MKNKELFDRTVGILVKAYQNGTLRHADCRACAVGNMIAENMGINPLEAWDHRWNTVFATLSGSEVYKNYAMYEDLAKIQIDSTGYNCDNLSLIEHSFEKGFGANQRHLDPDGYIGLMRVVDTLMLIHEATETEANQAKELFTLTV